MGAMKKKAQARRGPPLIAEEDRRIAFAVRIPRKLAEAFRDACGGKRGEATRVVETAIKRYCAKHGGG